MKDKGNIQRVLKLTGPFLGLRYVRAARLHENDGLEFTAAMEWRKAAELSSWISLLANRYWREWERIMHLPRRLAEPIGLAPVATAALQQNSCLRSELVLRPLVRPRITLPSAA
jgi:hypothetical protein